MEKIYSIPNCEQCNKIREFIEENNIEIPIVDLVDLEGIWHEKTDEGYIKFDESVKAYPAALLGKQGEQSIYVIGEEGIKQLLTKGYIYDSKFCPYLNKECIEKECSKFVIMNKGPLQEGGCADYWTPVILTELLSKGN